MLGEPFIRRILLPVILLAVTGWVYAPVTGHEFVTLDDPAHITANQQVMAGLSWEGARWALTSTHFDYWYPLTWLSHMLDVELFGLRAGSHHGVSLLFHLANTLLVYAFFIRTTRRPGAALFVAAFFAVHPLRVESVAWAAERKDVLSAFFWLLAMHAYAGFARAPSARRYSLVGLWFLLGLMSKPALVMLPLALLLLDAWPLARLDRSTWKARLAEKVPLLGLAGAMGLLTWLLQRARVQSGLFEPPPLLVRVGQAALSLVQYIGKTFWPTDLAPIYPYRYAVPAAAAGAAAAGLVVLTLALLYTRKRPLVVGWAWFLLLLLPVLGLLPFGSTQWGDRFTYLSGLGLFTVAAWAPGLLPRIHFPRLLAVAVLTAWVASALQTRAQVRVWADSRTLYEHTLRVTDNNWVAHNNLGAVLQRAGDLEGARRQFRMALTANPRYGDAYANLGGVAYREQDYARAARYYEQALAWRPGLTAAAYGLGLARAAGGDLEGAEEMAGQIESARPDWASQLRGYILAVEAP